MMGHLVSIVPVSSSRPRRVVGGLRHVVDVVYARIDPSVRCASAWPPIVWPALATIAAWPSIAWSLRRFGDRSDDPFGIVAWFALLFALFGARERFRHPVRSGRLAASALVAFGAALPLAGMPDLVRALASTIAVVLALAAIVDDDEPFVPYAGFALLALPLLSSLQFFAGFPLRVATAEASRWLLSADGWHVVRDGTALSVDGRIVLVDAPCSGVQMAWVGYFTACFGAWLFRLANVAALRRMPAVGLLVLCGNVARNTVLVDFEARGVGVDDRLHAAIGLIATAVVCVAIVAVFASCRDRIRALQRIRVETRARFFAPMPSPGRTAAFAMALFALAALLPLGAHPEPARAAAGHAIEWPTTYDDAPLVPIASSDVERRFAADFPGAIARFSNGPRTVVLREVDRPTRRLHPAADCFRGLGYAIAGERLERDVDARPRRCFAARRGADTLRVCERITDDAGHVYTDASSWYWAAQLGQSHGPWQAITVVSRE